MVLCCLQKNRAPISRYFFKPIKDNRGKMIVRAKSTERSRSMWYYIGSPSRFSSGSHSFTVSFQLNFGFQIALIAKIRSTLYFWQINVVLFAILFHGTTTTFDSPSSSTNGRFLNLKKRLYQSEDPTQVVGMLTHIARPTYTTTAKSRLRANTNNG